MKSRSERALNVAIAALGLYADPCSYRGLKNGDLSHVPDYGPPMPGDAARRAIRKIDKILNPRKKP